MNFKFLKTMFKYNKDVYEDIDYDFYKSIDIFYNLSKKEIQKLNDLFVIKTYKKDELIFKEGHPSSVFYIIITGKVKVFMNTENKEIPFFTLYPKNHFGEMGIFLETDRLASAVALEDSQLIAIVKSDFRLFIKSQPGTGIKLLYNLGKTVANELKNVYGQIKENEK